MEKISVILPVYNESMAFIKKSLNSIISQSYSNLEILVIIDAPDRKELVDFILEEKKNDCRIRAILNNKNIGLTASLNKGVGLACGDYIARMDADDISLPKRLERQLNYLKNNECDLVGCSVICIDMQDRIIDNRIIHVPVDDCSIKRDLRYYSGVFHPTWLGRRELFNNNAYYDYEACEDYEFLTRISLQGKKLGNVYEPLLKYRLNNASVSSRKKVIQRVGSLYVREHYRKGKICDYDDYRKYLKSSVCAKKRGQIEKCYKNREVMSRLIERKAYLPFAVRFVLLQLTNSCAREMLYDNLYRKMITERCNNMKKERL